MNATRNYVSPPESACDAVAKALAELGMKPTTFGAVKLAVDPGRDGAGGQRDGVGVDETPDVRLLAPVEENRDRADWELGVENDLRHGHIGDEDLFHEPREVEPEAPTQLQRNAFVVYDVHSQREIDDQRRRADPEADEHQGVVAREKQPENDENCA